MKPVLSTTVRNPSYVKWATLKRYDAPPVVAGRRTLKPHEPVSAEDGRGFLADRYFGRCLRLEAQHPTPSIAVHGRGRPTQDLDAPERPDVEMVQNRLAVRHCRRKPVHESRDAAYAERSPGAEATDGDPLTHGVVVPVLNVEAGDSLKRLVE